MLIAWNGTDLNTTICVYVSFFSVVCFYFTLGRPGRIDTSCPCNSICWLWRMLCIWWTILVSFLSTCILVLIYLRIGFCFVLKGYYTFPYFFNISHSISLYILYTFCTHLFSSCTCIYVVKSVRTTSIERESTVVLGQNKRSKSNTIKYGLKSLRNHEAKLWNLLPNNCKKAVCSVFWISRAFLKCDTGLTLCIKLFCVCTIFSFYMFP